MSLISENVIEGVSMWARQNEDKQIFSKAAREISSYYIDRDSEETYLQEYAIDTLADLKTSLEVYSRLPADSPIFNQILVEISRQRRKQPAKQNSKNNEAEGGGNNEDMAAVQEEKKRLPEHIYVF